MEDSKTTVQQEDANANLDEFKPKSEDEIRTQVVEEYDFDEVDDEEKIDKLVKKEVESQSKLSVAIKQKQTQRTDKEAYIQRMKDAGLDPETGNPLETKEKSKETKPELPEGVMTEEKYKEIKFQEELDDLGYDDDLKAEVEKVAKLNNQRPKQALEDSYIKFRIEEKEQKEGVEEAGLDNKPSGQVTVKSAITKKGKGIDVTKTDTSTPEAREKVIKQLDKEAQDAFSAGR